MHHCHCTSLQTDSTSGQANPGIARSSARLGLALGCIGGFASLEFLVGQVSQSLALVADSGHMVSDGLALALALFANRVTGLLPKQWMGSLLEAGTALINGCVLMGITGWIAWEALLRLQAPSAEFAGLPIVLTAGVGVGVNSISALLLRSGSQHDLNVRAAFLHVLADALSSIGVIVAAIAALLLHWFWADGAISLVIAGLILFHAVPLVWQSLYRFSTTLKPEARG